MSPEPDPRRTTSFSRSMISKRLLPVGRAISRWIEFVPMSMAASGSSKGSARATRSRLTAHALGTRDREEVVMRRARHLVDRGAFGAVGRAHQHLVEAAAEWAVPLRPPPFGIDGDRATALEVDVNVTREAGDVDAV